MWGNAKNEQHLNGKVNSLTLTSVPSPLTMVKKKCASIRPAITSIIIIFRFKFPAVQNKVDFSLSISRLLSFHQLKYFETTSVHHHSTAIIVLNKLNLATVQHVDDNDINENKGTTAPWGNSHE